MALNFVAAEDGLEEDPKILTLARMLKVDRAHAFWFVMRWRRLVVNAGNPISGSLPPNYTTDDLAAFLDWSGRPTALTSALKSTGFLGLRRGRALFYPCWGQTITGQYASYRERERQRKEEDRIERKSGRGTSADGARNVRGQGADASADSPRTGAGNLRSINKGPSADAPPTPPPAGGDLAEGRWAWLLENAPTPQDPGVSKRILAELTEDEWCLVQRAYESLKVPAGGVGTPSRKNIRVLHWPTDLFLRKHAYLRFRPASRPARGARTTVKVVELSPAEELEARLLQSDRYLLELLNDPDAPEEKKRAARERWAMNPENKGRRPPWKAPSAPTPANGAHRSKGLPS